jgi:two-component system sensor histidine kinase UhpB
VTVSTPVLPGQALVLAVGLAVMLVVNAVILRVALAPLRRLTRAMSTADLLRPVSRPAVTGSGEIAVLVATFNTMLDRLESERATSSARVLSAQEAERRRIARELHDEIGQTLTAVLLQLKYASDRAPEPIRADLRLSVETTRGSLDELRRIARRLRPGVLEELGLASALRALAGELSTPALSVRHRLTPGLAALDHDTEVVVYRVAQEGLTNAARHADADRATLELLPAPGGGVELLVGDNGRGVGDAPEGAGIRGMRERALLAGADLSIGPGPTGGTEIRLRLPAPKPRTPKSPGPAEPAAPEPAVPGPAVPGPIGPEPRPSVPGPIGPEPRPSVPGPIGPEPAVQEVER